MMPRRDDAGKAATWPSVSGSGSYAEAISVVPYLNDTTNKVKNEQHRTVVACFATGAHTLHAKPGASGTAACVPVFTHFPPPQPIACRCDEVHGLINNLLHEAGPVSLELLWGRFKLLEHGINSFSFGTFQRLGLRTPGTLAAVEVCGAKVSAPSIQQPARTRHTTPRPTKKRKKKKTETRWDTASRSVCKVEVSTQYTFSKTLPRSTCPPQ